jgi:DNA-directed RNA polymerase I subunit RPA43
MEVDEPAPKAKKPRQQKPVNGHARPQQSVPQVQAQAPAEPQIDERFLSARELKKKRKDEEKRKRDERKSRKEAGQIEALEEAGAAMMVGMNGEEPEVGSKRKAGDVEGEGNKRKKQ